MRALQRSGAPGASGVSAPSSRQEPDDLADEERVALGLGVQRADERLVRRESARRLDEARDVRVREAA